jgi:hypothetical protein
MIQITEVEGEEGVSEVVAEVDTENGMIGGEAIPGVYQGVEVEVGIGDLSRGKEDIRLLNQDP